MVQRTVGANTISQYQNNGANIVVQGLEFQLDADIIQLWWRKKLTVIFVTHSIYEAVFLSTRVIVMAARPGRVLKEVLIDEPHPRTGDFRLTPSFAGHCARLTELLALGAADGEGAAA